MLVFHFVDFEDVAVSSNVPNCCTGQITWMLVKRAALMCSVICVYVSAHMLIIAIHSDSQAQTFKRLERKKMP